MIYDDDRYDLTVRISGLCRGTDRRDARAAWGVWFAPHSWLNDSGLFKPGDRPTRARAELEAAHQALCLLLQDSDVAECRVVILSSSNDLVQALDQWLPPVQPPGAAGRGSQRQRQQRQRQRYREPPQQCSAIRRLLIGAPAAPDADKFAAIHKKLCDLDREFGVQVDWDWEPATGRQRRGDAARLATAALDRWEDSRMGRALGTYDE